MINPTTDASIVLNIILLLIIVFLLYPKGSINKAFIDFCASVSLPTDNLITKSWWIKEVSNQVSLTQSQEYNACIFGDSITSPLSNTLGEHTFNFALKGMSSVSLIEQLHKLAAAHVKCKKGLIAIGTNDACYHIDDDTFINNIEQAISLVREMGATQVILIPAFYSTVAASLNPLLAGTITRVEEINQLINQIAESQNVLVNAECIQELFEGKALKRNLTTDGVHLNADGQQIYRQGLIKLISGIVT